MNLSFSQNEMHARGTYSEREIPSSRSPSGPRTPTRCINLDLQGTMASPACREIFKLLANRPLPCNGLLMPRLTNRNRLTGSPASPTMLAGVTQRSDSDPYDAMSPPVTVGPQWMIIWLFDPKTTGLPTTQAHRRVQHVVRIAVRACAHHGTSIKRFSASALSMVKICS